MTLFEQIKKDRIQYMKNGQTKQKDVLGLFIGSMQTEEKNGNDLTDAFLISKLKKNLHNALEMFNLTHNDEFRIEAETYDQYIPKQMDEQELSQIVTSLKGKGFSNIGQFMQYFKANYDGRYDGKVLSKVVRDGLK